MATQGPSPRPEPWSQIEFRTGSHGQPRPAPSRPISSHTQLSALATQASGKSPTCPRRPLRVSGPQPFRLGPTGGFFGVHFPWKTCASHVKFHRGSASFTGYPVKLHPAGGHKLPRTNRPGKTAAESTRRHPSSRHADSARTSDGSTERTGHPGDVGWADVARTSSQLG